MPGDDVSLTDLEVIQRFSLAVRGASAPRDEVVAALRADLAFLTDRTPDRLGEPARAAARTPATRTSPPASVRRPRPRSRAREE